MPRIIKADDLTQGHCWPPTVPIPNPANKVFIEGKPVVAVGDQYFPHPGPCGILPPHPVPTVIGSPTVFVQGRPVVRDGDPLGCGDVANALGGTVYADGGGLGGPAAIRSGDPGQTTGYSQHPPVIEYPSTIIVRYREIRDPRGVLPTFFLGGCPFEVRPEMYTPLEEEGTGSIFRNYPGSPITTTAGTPNLPQYAPNTSRDPIPIFNIQLFGGGTSIAPGIEFDPISGRVFGQITSPISTLSPVTFRVSASNRIGQGASQLITIRSQSIGQDPC